MSDTAVSEQPPQQNEAENKTEEQPPATSATETTTKEEPKVVKNKKCVHKTDYEKDVVYLYQFGRCPVIPQISPFCFKVETWLRMTNLKYEVTAIRECILTLLANAHFSKKVYGEIARNVNDAFGCWRTSSLTMFVLFYYGSSYSASERNVVDHHMKFKSKKGQLPFVENNGEEIADSEIIIDSLSEKYGKNLDEHLASEQKILSHAFTSMLNNHTSWIMRWFRYSQPDQFRKASQFDVKRESGSVLPKRVINFVFKMKFKHKIGQTISHGLGNHKKEEIIEFGKKDLNSLSGLLGEKQFFFGDTPSLLDCEVFAHISQFWYLPTDPEITKYLEESCSNLVRFLDRMKERYWSDWEELCKIPEPVIVKKEEKNGVTKTDEEKKDKEKEKDEAEKEVSEEKETPEVKEVKEVKEKRKRKRLKKPKMKNQLKKRKK
ncbi:Failed axon connections [Nymphon striatum]|nr:Failed axon connections [Nymphon striatum]